MAALSNRDTSLCSNCDRVILSANFDLHFAHCSRKLVRCKVCHDMIPKVHAEEHYLNTHAPVACQLCSRTMERNILNIHRNENCPRRIVSCDFCEFPLPAIDLAEHQEVCGNRTELCHLCHRYVRLRELHNHEDSCSRIRDNSTGPSRYVRPAERGDEEGRRRPQNDFSKKRVFFTIAITGIAVILGSIFFQRKTDLSNVQ